MTGTPAMVRGGRQGRLVLAAAAVGVALTTSLIAGCGASNRAQVNQQQSAPIATSHRPTPPTGPAMPANSAASTTPPTAGGQAAGAAQTKMAELDKSLAEVDHAMTAATDAQAQENR